MTSAEEQAADGGRLARVRMIDLRTGLAGPLAGTTLGDLGARVIEEVGDDVTG